MSDAPAPDAPADDRPVVYELADDCTADDLEEGARYHGTVDGVVNYGVFVQLADDVSGLVHESVLETDHEVGDELVVELTEIRANGDLSFVPADPGEYAVEAVEHEYDVTPVDGIDEREGEVVHLDGRLVQIKQTGGPTLFHVADGTGVVPCAAFERAGVRAYPEFETGDLVHVVGRVEDTGHGRQVEADAVTALEGDALEAATDRYDENLAEAAAPADIDPLVDWEPMAQLWDDLEAVAERLRRAVLEGQPVVIRHHADTDGIAAGVALEAALESFIAETHANPDAPRHLVKRLPSKAPYYEVEDATRDLGHALSNRERHGQQLPLFVMVDNGSTEEDTPAYRHLRAYDVPVLVIDHHHPDPEAVAPFVAEHVNPYLVGDDYRVTVGMLSVEIARLVEPALTDRFRHVPAVAGLADRSSADAMADYLALAEDAGYDEDRCQAIGDALDYAAYWLRYDAGHGVIQDVLDVAGHPERHDELIELLRGRAHDAIRRQLDGALEHREETTLDSGVRLVRVDMDEHAHRFTYPAPGTTTGAIHDHVVRETGEPVITMGIGPDFAVLRSDGVRLDIPRMVEDLNDELAGAGVSGGGHLVVGSIRFVKGMREQVLDALIAEMAEAEIDETLGAASPRDYTLAT
ncbi:MAG: DHH family phosphoesterase [Halobacteriales archaeon]|nr:DHH family phosphoesterase [Halobacteriales archaeon]